MFAIVEFAGFQHVIRKGDLLQVPSQNTEPGVTINLDKVLVFSDGTATKVGQPYVAGAGATAEVVEHFRGPKMIVFRKRRRKAYRRRKGYRSDFTTLRITEITA